MFRVNYRPPEALPSHHRDFPPEVAADLLHERDSFLLLTVVIGYILAMLGGVFVLHALTPVAFEITQAAKLEDAHVNER